MITYVEFCPILGEKRPATQNQVDEGMRLSNEEEREQGLEKEPSGSKPRFDDNDA